MVFFNQTEVFPETPVPLHGRILLCTFPLDSASRVCMYSTFTLSDFCLLSSGTPFALTRLESPSLSFGRSYVFARLLEVAVVLPRPTFYFFLGHFVALCPPFEGPFRFFAEDRRSLENYSPLLYYSLLLLQPSFFSPPFRILVERFGALPLFFPYFRVVPAPRVFVFQLPGGSHSP